MPSSPPANPSPAGLPRNAPRPSRAKWYLLGGIVLLLGAGGAAYFKKRNSSRVTVITTENAIVKNIIQVVSATGKIQPEVEVKIAPEVSGEIIELPFREGAAVKKGDLLVSIKPDNYRFQVEQQEANLAANRAAALDSKVRLLKAEEDLKRSQDLHDKKLIADADLTAGKAAFESAQANYESALANIRRAEGSLNQARDQLTKTVIYSPIDGTISSRTSEVGERVASTGQYNSAEVMRVADLSNMEVLVKINENDIINVKVGDKTRVVIDAFPGRKFDAVVKEIGSAAKTTGQNTQEEVTNFQVRIRVLDKNAPLRPGMSATADIETKQVENVVAVPIQSVTVRTRQGNKTVEQLAAERDKKTAEAKGKGAALAVNTREQKQRESSDRENLQRVVFLRKGGVVKSVLVETGLADTTHIEVKSGVQAGDEVVSGPFSAITRTLSDGMKVTLDPKLANRKK